MMIEKHGTEASQESLAAGQLQQASVSVAEPTRDAVADFEARRAQSRAAFASSQPKQLSPEVRLTPETEAAIREREERQHQIVEQRRRAELHGRFGDLVHAAGGRYRLCTLDTFRCTEQQQSKVVAAIHEHIQMDSSDSVVLYGPVGTGKDHLAFALCREAIRSGKTVGWINGQKWFGIVRDAMDTNRSEESLIADLRRPDVLCLSDPLPPVGPLTQYQSTMLYRLVDARYSRGVPTICTINVANDQEADERMGAATWDRLCHGAWKLHCRWDTYRKPAREI